MIHFSKLVLAFMLFTSAAFGNEPEKSAYGAVSTNADAPAELAHMQNMIGRWAIEDWSLGQDGAWRWRGLRFLLYARRLCD